MPILDHCINNHIRLIDYERIVDSNNNRLIAFGLFAGLAGAIDFLYGIG
jgi:alpha-aminoadipic semialdehyde synthase